MNTGNRKPVSGSRLALEGDLTIYTAAATLATLQKHLQDCDRCELDLSGVSEIDSAGLQLLLWAARQAADKGERLRLVAPSDAVTEVIALLQLGARFDGQGNTAETGDLT